MTGRVTAEAPLRANRVLLLDEGWLQTVDLAAALETAGFAVTVLTANGSTASYQWRTVQWCSGPEVMSTGFYGHLDQLMHDSAFDHVLPLTESALFRLWDARPAWADHIYPAIDAWQHRLLRDKHLLVEHMALRGVPVPRQRRLSPALDSTAIVQELGLPLVLKAAAGAGGSHVRIVESSTQLARDIRRARHLGGDWAVQELVPGPTYLFGGVFDRGRPLRIYAAEKLAQHPARTGPAIWLRSDDDPVLIDVALRAFRELRWTGLASADFIYAGGGRYVLLEVNPRPWGSIAAARSAGVDMFGPFAQLLAGGTPLPDLRFAAGREHHVFPRYLLSPVYWRPAGVARALRDLLGPQGQPWREAGFARHLIMRLCRLRRAGATAAAVSRAPWG